MKLRIIVIGMILSFSSSYGLLAQTPKEQKTVGTFHAINSPSGINVYYTQSKTCSVEIEADAEVMDKIEVKVENGTLILVAKKGENIATMTYLSPDRMRSSVNIKAHVSAPVIDTVTLSHGSDFYTSQLSNQTNLLISASHGSDVCCNQIKMKECYLQFSGGSDCEIKQIDVKTLNINAAGGSDLNINLTDAASVNAEASGGSSIILTGKAGIINGNSGGASVIDITGLIYQTINPTTLQIRKVLKNSEQKE
jgi:hypothetical protein